MKIIINGIERDVSGTEVSYADIVLLAGKQGQPSVKYSGPQHGDTQRNGTMHYGCPIVALEEGMVFSVVHTGNS